MFRRARPDAVAVTPSLWVGSAPSAGQLEQLVRDGITAVVDLRAEATDGADWPGDVVVVRVPLVDHGAPTGDELRAAAERVTALLRDGRRVLVHCRAGLERSPAVACAVLMAQGWSLADAYRLVAERRRGAAPTDGQLAALRELEAAR